MNEVSFKSISTASFNKDNITKHFNSQYSIIPDSSFTNNNGFKVATAESKEVSSLKKAVYRLEKNISLIQNDHSQMLKGLHVQMERLREQNQELQFQLVMRSGPAMAIYPSGPIDYPSLEEGRKASIPDPDYESASLQILKLKEAIEEEKARNLELICKLNSLGLKNEDGKPVEDNEEKIRSTIQMKTSEEINITPNIRISLAPLTVSLFHEESNRYVTNINPTVDDCELVIRTLLEKTNPNLLKGDGASSIQDDEVHKSNAAPLLKRHSQNLNSLSRNSAKLNPLLGTLSSRPMGLNSNHQKLSPIVSHQDDVAKLEEESYRMDVSRKSGRDNWRGNTVPFSADAKTGCSLPALPRPADYNQAEKQRRLHLLQRKRLDNYNNKL